MVIKAKQVQKNYRLGKDDIPVIRDVNLAIEKGDFVSIIGPSGSGKTTLLYLLSGLEAYTAGSIELFGQELNEMSRKGKAKLRQNDISFIFQFYNLIPSITVEENLRVAQVLSSKKKRWEIDELLAWVGLTDYTHYYPHQLSGGMQQRVAIARSLINDPQIIFADEPIGNLDLNNGHAIMGILKRLNEEFEKTVVLVTHNEDMVRYGNRVIRLIDGRIVSDETLVK